MKSNIDKIPRSWLALWAGLVLYFLITYLPWSTSYSFVVGLFLFASGFIPAFIVSLIDRKNALVSALSVYVLVSLDRFWVNMQYMGDQFAFKDCMGNAASDLTNGSQSLWYSIKYGFDLTTLAGFLVGGFLVWLLVRKYRSNIVEA